MAVIRQTSIVRTFFFCVFFAVGTAVLSGSVLCGVLRACYRDKYLLHAQQQNINNLKSLIADYNAVLTEIEKDPNFVKRLAPAALGAKPDDADAVHPKATAGQLAAVRRILAQEKKDRESANPPIPEWLSRCSTPRRRIILFIAGAVLILISFVCFGTARQKNAD